MGFFDRPLLDFNEDGKTDFMEWSIGMQMTANNRQKAIDLTGDNTFYFGIDISEEDDDTFELLGLDRDKFDMMDEDERQVALEEVDLDLDNYDEY